MSELIGKTIGLYRIIDEVGRSRSRRPIPMLASVQRMMTGGATNE